MELALIFVLQVSGLVLGLALGRAAFSDVPSVAVRRVVAAVERAARAFVARMRAGLTASIGVAAALVLAGGFASGHPETGEAAAAGVVLGGALGFATAFVATVLGSRSLGAAVVGAGARFELALCSAVKGAGAAGIVAQALGVLGALAFVGGGLWLNHAQPALAGGAAFGLGLKALPGYALGAGISAFFAHATAGAYATAARGGTHWASAIDPRVLPHDAKNPGLVANLVGDRLEHGAAATRLFGATACAVAGVFAPALAAGTGAAVDLRGAVLPLLLWSFGLVANGAGLFVVRSLEAQGATPALARGQGSAAAVWLVGLLGGGYWLFPDAWPRLAAAGAVGLVGGAVGPFLLIRAFARRHGPLRDALDSLRAGAAATQAGAFGFGLGQAALSLLVVTGFALVAARLGEASGVAGGEQLALMVALFAAMSSAPFALAVAGGAALADSARGVANLGGASADAQSRLQRVSDTSQGAAAIAEAHLILTQGLAALAAVLGLAGSLAAGTVPPGSPPAVIPVLGAALVLGLSGLAARRSGRAARDVALEVERQLGASPQRDEGEDGRAPSYRSCEEVAGRAGLAGVLGSLTLAIGGPVVLGIALRLVYRESGPRLAAEALATLVAGAAVTALGVALAVDGARVVLTTARRASRPEGDSATHAASVTGSALAEVLASAVGPAACTAALITASLAILANTLIH
jgi:K(+)-stimulated pyrophosphate-energized sodium pump